MGDPITWYILGKDVGDPTTIEEQIDADILTHNIDPSSHGQVDESVYEHRNDDRIDHPAYSIYNIDRVPSTRSVMAFVQGAGAGDFVGIQEAIDYVELHGGGKVLVKKGIYYPKDKINLPSDIQLEGESGTDTIIDFSTAVFSAPFFASIQAIGTSITTDGTFSINNGATAVVGIGSQFVVDKVSQGDKFYINGVPYTVDTIADDLHLALVETFRGSNVAGDDVKIEQNIENVTVKKVTVRESTEYGIKFLRVINGKINHCIATKCDGGIAMDGYQVEVDYNNCFNNEDSASADGIYISGNAASCFGNFSANNRGSGILVGGGGVVVLNNHVNNNDVNGIYVGALRSRVTIADNVLQGNDFHGIIVAPGCHRIKVLGNTVEDSGQDGIHVSGTAGNPTSRVMVVGNTTNGEAGDGIELTANTSNCEVIANSFFGGVNDLGAGNDVAHNV